MNLRTRGEGGGQKSEKIVDVLNESSLSVENSLLEAFSRTLGTNIKDVRKIFGFLGPSPLVRKFTQPPLLIANTMSAFGYPPPPPGADVLYVWPLSKINKL